MKTTLEEALRQGIVKIGDYIDYKPEFGRCVLTRKQTGWKKEQEFATEELGWRLDESIGDLILIASEPTSGLWLRGETGCLKGIEAMRTLCQIAYSNPHFSKKVIPMTEGMQKKIGRKYVTRGSYWLGSGAVGTYYYGFPCFGICYVSGSSVDAKKYYLNYIYGDEEHQYFGVRPVVCLKSKIQLKGGLGTKSDPWKLIGTEERLV